MLEQLLTNLGVQKALYTNSQVLCLPENILTYKDEADLIEPADQIWLVKRLREEGLSVFWLIDAGIEVGTIERRGDEKWFGHITIDKVVLPILVSILSGIGVVIYDRATKTDDAVSKVHVDLHIKDQDQTRRIQFDGDGESLVKMLEALNEKTAP